MNLLDRLKNSIMANTNLWIVLWILFLLNFLTVLVLLRGVSLLTVVLFFLLAFLGIGGIKLTSVSDLEMESIPEETREKVENLMQEVKNLGNEIFNEEINRISQSLKENLQQDFSSGLTWLWENLGSFIVRVEEESKKIATIPDLIDSLNEEKSKLVKRLKESLNSLYLLANNINSSKEKDFLRMEESFADKIEDLKEEIEKEQEIFYDYVYKLLLTQVKNQEDDDVDITTYFSMEKLEEQLSVIVEKSLEARMLGSQEAIIKQMEEFSADVVGKMQNNALQLTNNLKSIQDILQRLLNECKDGSYPLLTRLHDCHDMVDELREQGGEIMVTLAWYDILVEKRWQEIQEKLLIVKEQVNENVDDDVKKYMAEILDEEIPGVSEVLGGNKKTVFYKSLRDAELVYQLLKGRKLISIIENGVYSLLQFIRPLELLVNKGLRLSEEGIRTRKLIKGQVRAGEYNGLFERVKKVVASQNPKLEPYLENIFPSSLFNFCNNPHVKQKTDDFTQAAWGLFLDLIDDREKDENIYFLIGLLLIIHQLRNKYIHPLKSLPVMMENEDEIEDMRYACYQAINILLFTEIKGIVTVNLNK